MSAKKYDEIHGGKKEKIDGGKKQEKQEKGQKKEKQEKQPAAEKPKARILFLISFIRKSDLQMKKNTKLLVKQCYSNKLLY